MKLMLMAALLVCGQVLWSQPMALKDSSTPVGKVSVFKDSRLEMLAKKEAEFNEAIALGPKLAKGYRLMVLNTNDRSRAMNLRGNLLQKFPEQKVYMSF